MYQLILLIHVFIAVCIVALVLVQQGKGATMGAAFGSGASQTVFGSRGSGSFLFRITIGLAVVFFITSIALNYVAMRAYKQEAAVQFPIVPALKGHEGPGPVIFPANQGNSTKPEMGNSVGTTSQPVSPTQLPAR